MNSRGSDMVLRSGRIKSNKRGSDMVLRSGRVKSNNCVTLCSSSSLLADEKKELACYFQSLKRRGIVCCISSDDEVYLPLRSESKKKKVPRRKPLQELILDSPGGESSDSPDSESLSLWRSRPVVVYDPEATAVFPYSIP
jgi:hypothetical protein